MPGRPRMIGELAQQPPEARRAFHRAAFPGCAMYLAPPLPPLRTHAVISTHYLLESSTG